MLLALSTVLYSFFQWHYLLCNVKDKFHYFDVILCTKVIQTLVKISNIVSWQALYQPLFTFFLNMGFERLSFKDLILGW